MTAPAAEPSVGQKSAIRTRALEAGFDSVGFASADARPERLQRLETFLSLGRHGDMDWMEQHQGERASPDVLWSGAKSIVMLGVNYGLDKEDGDVLADLKRPSLGVVSLYARRKDYHDVVKKRLRALARWVHEEYATPVKLFVDTAPVMEKPLAADAGLGWQGKHTNLVSREFGSWLFLGAVYTGLDLPPDAAHDDRCGNCRACLDVCPTSAFPAPYQLDARRCIAYLTIEHRGHIAREFRAGIGNRVFGCDDCLAVCPWNRFASAARLTSLAVREGLGAPPLETLLDLDDAGFRALFRGTPVKRTGRNRFLRNVLIAAGNSGDISLLPEVRHLLDDTSPLVRAMAVWALSRLADAREFDDERAARANAEADSDVQAEWSVAVAD